MNPSSLLCSDSQSTLQAVRFIKLADALRELDKSRKLISQLWRAMLAVRSKNLYREAVVNTFWDAFCNDIRDSVKALRYLKRFGSFYLP